MSVAHIRTDLLTWYDANRRDLPWRAAVGEKPDPYRVWLSEIMLQQTTAAHATPYFVAFTSRWPTVEALGRAKTSDVMAAWSGLGYYARARNLMACARQVTETGGVFPSAEADLRALPGIGQYSAAAISAIAHGEATNVVDANVQRVIARLFAVETELPAAARELKVLAERLVRPERAGDWPQALMDLGALVCRPLVALCGECPIAPHCLARSRGEPQTYPKRRPKADRPARHGVAYVMTHARRVAMIQRPTRGLLGGMLGLPTSEWREGSWNMNEAVAAAPMALNWCVAGTVHHMFTHFSLTLDVLSGGATTADPSFLWMLQGEARSAAPTVFRKAIALGL